jgi:hypothetical protein
MKLTCGTNDDINVYDVAGGTLLFEGLQEYWVCCVLWSSKRALL